MVEAELLQQVLLFAGVRRLLADWLVAAVRVAELHAAHVGVRGLSREEP